MMMTVLACRWMLLLWMCPVALDQGLAMQREHYLSYRVGNDGSLMPRLCSS